LADIHATQPQRARTYAMPSCLCCTEFNLEATANQKKKLMHGNELLLASSNGLLEQGKSHD
jgi:hypothetical protein